MDEIHEVQSNGNTVAGIAAWCSCGARTGRTLATLAEVEEWEDQHLAYVSEFN